MSSKKNTQPDIDWMVDLELDFKPRLHFGFEDDKSPNGIVHVFQPNVDISTSIVTALYPNLRMDKTLMMIDRAKDEQSELVKSLFQDLTEAFPEEIIMQVSGVDSREYYILLDPNKSLGAACLMYYHRDMVITSFNKTSIIIKDNHTKQSTLIHRGCWNKVLAELKAFAKVVNSHGDKNGKK